MSYPVESESRSRSEQRVGAGQSAACPVMGSSEIRDLRQGHRGLSIPLATERLLDVKGLKTYFRTDQGVSRAVDDVTFHLDRGEVLGMVGESGCGKSVTALTIMRLLPEPPAFVAGGQILLGNRNLLEVSPNEMRKTRGGEVAMIFQEPMTSLNPVFTVGYQIMEGYRAHTGVSRREARARAVDLMKMVGISAADRRLDDYPHQFSGGMRQRIVIAMALVCNPRLLIADEPTTALDVTIQAQILDLMNRLRTELTMSVLLITHDLAVVAETARRVIVMYAGRIVESAPVAKLFDSPLHPYTQGLLNSVPRVDRRVDRLPSIEGTVPSLFRLPLGCAFHDRCLHRFDPCRSLVPPLRALPGAPDRLVACHLHIGA